MQLPVADSDPSTESAQLGHAGGTQAIGYLPKPAVRCAASAVTRRRASTSADLREATLLYQEQVQSCTVYAPNVT